METSLNTPLLLSSKESLWDFLYDTTGIARTVNLSASPFFPMYNIFTVMEVEKGGS